MNKSLLKALSGYIGPEIVSVARRMEIAEKEISRAKKRDPSRADLYHSAFMLVRPTDLLHGKADRAYQAHVRELLRRVERGRDTRLGTAAEVLCGMLGAATIAPLNAEGAALVERLFQIVMRKKIDGPPAREVWPGQIQEAFTEAQRKTKQIWRVTKKIK